jgi:integrase
VVPRWYASPSGQAANSEKGGALASLQARHSPDCPAAGKSGWTPFSKTTKDAGCTCEPRYYTVVRRGKRNEKQAVGNKRAAARKALTALQAKIDEGSYQAQRSIRFEDWADIWIDSLDGVKENTKDSYRPTMDYAKRAFGWKQVRKLEPQDVREFLRVMQKAGAGPSTQSKHLRVLGSSLSSAIAHGYAARNPARELPKSERPRMETKESAYFANDELSLVFAKLPAGLYRTLFELALKTGMRQGELVALRWGDVDLTEAVIRVRGNFTAGRLTDTKNRERRDVFLTPDTVGLLGRWWGEGGESNDEALVFPGFGPSGYLSCSTLVNVLYAAMEAAEVPRVGPTGEERTFHSLRHTFARIALEANRPLAWVSHHLGHSGVQVTDKCYGHFAREQRKIEMESLAGAFVV